MSHRNGQVLAYSGQIAPSVGAYEEQTSEQNMTSLQHAMDVNIPESANAADGDMPTKSRSKEATEMEALSSGENGDVLLESRSNEDTNLEALTYDGNDEPVKSNSNEETRME